MQGKNESLLTVTYMLNAFQLKLNLWHRKVEKGVIEMFPFREAAVAKSEELQVLKKWICNHLYILQQKLFHYFRNLNISC